jgi:hypothetical protein
MRGFQTGHPSIPDGRNPKYPTQLNSFTANQHHSYPIFTMAALATKTQSQNIFSKLKSKPANKVRFMNTERR